MVIQKKSLVNATTKKKKTPGEGANPAPQTTKKLAVTKPVTAKLATAKLSMLRKVL